MTTHPLIIFCGYARSGKDTAAAALTGAGWQQRSFAASLKDLALILDPPMQTSGGQLPLSAVVDRIGWERAKDEVPGVRPYLQTLGHGARRAVGDDVWIRAALRCLPIAGVVLADGRYPNELEAVRDLGGIVVRVVRPGVGPANDHPTETALADVDVDHEVVNDGTVEDLHRAVQAIANLHYPTRWACAECGDGDPVEGMKVCLACLSGLCA